MFSFFHKKNKVEDIAWLGIDVHSHLLPGIDDGAEKIEDSLRYISHLAQIGFSRLICTPHIYSDIYPNSPDTILPALDSTRAAVNAAGITIQLDAAAEYMAEGTFIAGSGLLTLPGNCILIEMSYLAETVNIDQIIFDLQTNGYRVILAHPERYNFYHGDLKRFQRFRDIGCLLQLNLLSVLGYYGKHAKSTAESLLQNKLYDIAGTDLHHDKHLAVLEANVQNGTVYDKLGHYDFLNKELFTL